MKLIALTSFMFDRPIAGGAEFDCECPINAHSLVSTGVARYKSADAKPVEQAEAAEPDVGVEDQDAEPEQPKPEQPKRRRK